MPGRVERALNMEDLSSQDSALKPGMDEVFCKYLQGSISKNEQRRWWGLPTELLVK